MCKLCRVSVLVHRQLACRDEQCAFWSDCLLSLASPTRIRTSWRLLVSCVRSLEQQLNDAYVCAQIFHALVSSSNTLKTHRYICCFVLCTAMCFQVEHCKSRKDLTEFSAWLRMALSTSRYFAIIFSMWCICISCPCCWYCIKMTVHYFVGYLHVVFSPSHTHTHTHPFNGPFSRTTRVGRYQKGKTNLDFTEARDSEWQWH